MNEINKDEFSLIKKFIKNMNEDCYRNIVVNDDKLKEIIFALSSSIKNNILITGFSGVGKTSIIKSLVKEINNNNVPNFLLKKQIYLLKTISLMSGAKYQGELEERIENIIEFISESINNAILFIDDINLIFGSENQYYRIVSNLLKIGIESNNLQCIGTITTQDYKKYLEKDKFFSKNFLIINLEEPDDNETFLILNNIKETFLEEYYGIKIEEGAIRKSIILSKRFDNGFFPEKALNLLDEACSMVRSQLWYEPSIIIESKKKINDLKKRYDELTSNNLNGLSIETYKIKKQLSELEENLKELIILDNDEKLILLEIRKISEYIKVNYSDSFTLTCKNSEKRNNEISENLEDKKLNYNILKEKLLFLEQNTKKNKFRINWVTESSILTILSKKRGISIENLNEDDRSNLINLLPNLQKRIKNQDEALSSIIDSILRYKADLLDENKPLASFIFVGPTGVGKTEVALALSEQLFKNKNSLFRLDMSEFSEPHAISKLIGSPPGYTGFEQVCFFEIFNNNVNNIILLDEIEKAHIEVINLFLQILDNGLLRLSNGKEINFKNSIIIMTSNVGYKEYFHYYNNKEELIKRLENHINNHFRPEFLNRVTEIIFFNPLDKQSIKEIIEKELNIVKDQVFKKKFITINYTKKVVDKILSDAFSYENGARSIKRYIEKNIYTIISKFYIFGLIKEGYSCLLEVEEESNDIILNIISFLEK